MSKPSYYMTTAITYPNGEPHIGHAYEYISADVMAVSYTHLTLPTTPYV